MAENYMKQYVELAKKYKASNNSQETIERIYGLMNILEENENKDSKIVLVYVYTLLACHKKAYDLYVKIYDQNDRKQKAKLFGMEQLSKSHGDNFAIKLKKKPIINKMVSYCVDDFIEKHIIGDYKYYELNKTCIIFNQTLDNKRLEIGIYKEFILSEYIEKINEYIYWLGGECKNELIKYFNQNMNSVEEKADDEWYEALEVYCVRITLTKTRKLCADIACGDNNIDHILDIETEENKIYAMNING
jgi:hypothetical protein